MEKDHKEMEEHLKGCQVCGDLQHQPGPPQVVQSRAVPGEHGRGHQEHDRNMWLSAADHRIHQILETLADSLLDHFCFNCSQRTIRTFNKSRGASDHNVVGIEVAIKDIKNGGNNLVKRVWKKL